MPRIVSCAVVSLSGTPIQLGPGTAPSNPETYYYGACVDAVAEESDTDQQLLVVGRGHGSGPAAAPEPVGGLSIGERQ